MSSNRWRHVPTDTEWLYIGEDRYINSGPCAVMQKADDENIKARIDPLDLYKRNGDWKKVG